VSANIFDTAEWLDRFHRGDRSALAQCYQSYFGLVRAVLATYVQGCDLDSVVHEVFFKLIEKSHVRKQFTGGSMPAWLSTMARNQAIDFIRRYNRSSQLAVDLAAQADAPQLLAIEENVWAKQAVEQFKATLSPEQSQIFELVFIEGLDQQQVAESLEMSRSSVSRKKNRIAKRLRAFVRRVAKDRIRMGDP
jgi:RNA polymerase sigma-70 factor (ECF subfamily)